MSQWTDMYRQKLMTPEEAVKVVQSGDWVDYGMGTTQPILLDQALAARRDELQDVKVRMCLSVAPRQIIEQDPERKAFTAMNWYMSGYDRKLIKYIAEEDKLAKVLENPSVIRTPIVRNGKQSTIGYCPEVWKGWN